MWKFLIYEHCCSKSAKWIEVLGPKLNCWNDVHKTVSWECTGGLHLYFILAVPLFSSFIKKNTLIQKCCYPFILKEL